MFCDVQYKLPLNDVHWWMSNIYMYIVDRSCLHLAVVGGVRAAHLVTCSLHLAVVGGVRAAHLVTCSLVCCVVCVCYFFPFVLFVFVLCLVCTMLPVSLHCPFLIVSFDFL